LRNYHLGRRTNPCKSTRNPQDSLLNILIKKCGIKGGIILSSDEKIRLSIGPNNHDVVHKKFFFNCIDSKSKEILDCRRIRASISGNIYINKGSALIG